MNCGPEDVNCADALARVYEYIDGEMRTDDIERVRSHLSDCGPCLKEYGVEEEVKALVARCHPCDPAPDSLRDKVLARLKAAQAVAEQGDPTFGGSALTSPGYLATSGEAGQTFGLGAPGPSGSAGGSGLPGLGGPLGSQPPFGGFGAGSPFSF